ncbi:MAG: Ezrin/radixin/moesin family protein [Bacteroidetes bacterium]|nr:Ezrin/radixin/moesin family protein [Bacteroidota bacterium]
MLKYILPTLTALCLTTSATATDLTKEEKKAIKTELKGYKKDPAKYRAMLDRFKETIDSNEARISKDKEQINQLTNDFSDAQKKLIERGNELKECQNKPEPKCPEVQDALAIPATGTVYKVQLGLYRKFDMNSFFAKPKYVGSEKVDGLNRYIVSYFDNKEEAEHFAGDLRKLGLKDAFVAKYAEGQRIYEKDSKKKTAAKPAKKEKVAADSDAPKTAPKIKKPAPKAK